MSIHVFQMNAFFPMNIPTALGKLGDARAIPLLAKIIEQNINEENDESDSSHGLFASCGKSRLRVEFCLALTNFISKF